MSTFKYITVVTSEGDESFPVKRLKKALEPWQIRVLPVQGLKKVPLNAVIFDTPKNNNIISDLVQRKILKGWRPEEAESFALKSCRLEGQDILVVAGSDYTGLIYAANKLGEIRSGSKKQRLPIIDIAVHPRFKHRAFWCWDHATSWYLKTESLNRYGSANHDYQRGNDNYVKDIKLVIDFMSENRLNMLLLFGFLRSRDYNWGKLVDEAIATGKELTLYAKERGVTLYPGVGVTAYGGPFYDGEHEFCMPVWLAKHPELAAVGPSILKGIFINKELPGRRPVPVLCPSKKENIEWLKRGVRWLHETFPAAGAYLEQGDCGVCQCNECRSSLITAPAPFSWTMMHRLYNVLAEEIRSVKPNDLIVLEMYARPFFSKKGPYGFDNPVNQKARKLLSDFPRNSVMQWLVNAMGSNWPKSEDIPGRPSEAIVRVEWAAGWNSAHRLVYEELADIQCHAIESGFEGVSMFGEVSAHHVNNEINYIAQGAYAFDDSQISTSWLIKHKLAPRLGGEKKAERFLDLAKLIHNHRLPSPPSRDLCKAMQEVESIIKESSGEVLRRWLWLYDRLYAWDKMSGLKGAKAGSAHPSIITLA